MIAVIALGLAPGTWLRTTPVTPGDGPVRIVELAVPALELGPFTLAGAWHLRSSDGRFGGYSALIANSQSSLIAASDAGRLLAIRREGGRPVEVRLDRIARARQVDKVQADIESLTRDPVSSDIWAAYESRNAIQRFDENFHSEALVNPPAMRGWGANSGPEAFTRLPDGRFIAIEESEIGWADGRHRALLFPGDPTQGAEPIEFVFEGPREYRPVDLMATPEGQVLILMRRLVWWALPPRFEGAILIADPGRIAKGGVWRGRMLARLQPPLPTDNFEGMTLTQEAGGATYLWLISDDNFTGYQRTLLLKLKWNRAKQKARRRPARP